MSDNPAPGFRTHPKHSISIEPAGKTVELLFAGKTVASSSTVLTLREGSYPPVYYFPRQDVRMDLTHATSHSTYCPFKGDASYWSVCVGDNIAENAIWSYENPYDEMRQIEGYVAFYWQRMDSLTIDGQAVDAPV